MRRVAAVLLGLACAVLGAGVSLCAVALHGYAWGLLLGLAATVATLIALPGGPCRFGFAAGWALLLGLVAPARGEGDYVVASDLSGYVLLGFGILVFAGGFVGLVSRPVRADDAADDSGRVETAP